MRKVTFTRRQVALTLRILMQGESLKHLAKETNTAAEVLRLIAAGDLGPSAGVLSYFDLRRRGSKFVWQF